jgi:TPR repeat protein
MTQKLVRCIEGHVYNSLAHDKCPVCGSPQAHSESVPQEEQKKPAKKTAVDRGGAVKPGQPVFIAGGAAALLLLLVGAWAIGLFGSSEPNGPAGPGQQEAANSDKPAVSDSTVVDPLQASTASNEPEPGKKSEPGENSGSGGTSKSNTAQESNGPVNDCDRYAMSPVDLDRIDGTPGVMTTSGIDPNIAIPACERAVRDHPDERRYKADLGRAYRAAKNDVKAAEAYKHAADEGSLFGTYALGIMARDGAAMPRDPAKARTLLVKAADGGMFAAMLDYANMLRDGIGGPKDAKEAARWLQKAVDADYLPAINQLGSYYLEGALGPADPAKARELFERAAKQNDAAAIGNVGFLYEKGLGVKKDIVQARAQYVQAADRGNTWAMRRLAELALTHKTFGVGQQNESEKWLKKAAALGDSEAMTKLGYGYRNAKFGGFPDYATSRQWFEKAAEAGNAEAMNEIGYAYNVGQGVPRDYGIARSWYQRAAELGNSSGRANLGLLYEFGSGVPLNYSKAWQFYEGAAERGNAFAMLHLGQMLQYGKGMNANLSEALRWYEKAGIEGNADGTWRAVQLLDRYSKEKKIAALAKLALSAAKRGSQEAIQALFREPQHLSRELRAAIEAELASAGFYDGAPRGRFDRKSREALQAFLRGNR